MQCLPPQPPPTVRTHRLPGALLPSTDDARRSSSGHPPARAVSPSHASNLHFLPAIPPPPRALPPQQVTARRLHDTGLRCSVDCPPARSDGHRAARIVEDHQRKRKRLQRREGILKVDIELVVIHFAHQELRRVSFAVALGELRTHAHSDKRTDTRRAECGRRRGSRSWRMGKPGCFCTRRASRGRGSRAGTFATRRSTWARDS